ncbi:MAG: pyruvate kinase [Pirellulaceae bacterium]
MPGRFTAEKIAAAIAALTQLRDDQVGLAQSWMQELEQVPLDYRPSALNLLHYLALRQHDLRPLQRDLSSLGLSSLGQAEAHALACVDAVLAALHKLGARTMERPDGFQLPVDFASGPQSLACHTELLLGPAPTGRQVRIMVTMPSEAADSYDLVCGLLRAGMDVMRINSAHDDPFAWRRMTDHLRRATAACNRPCRILFDLQGPKLRTGPLQPGPEVVHWSPRRGLRGELIRPIMVRLAPASSHGLAHTQDVLLPVEAHGLELVRPGDELLLADCRGMDRRLRVVAVDAQSVLTESRSTAFVESGAAIHWQPADPPLASAAHRACIGRIGSLPACDHPLVLREDDRLVVTGPEEMGRPALCSADGVVLTPACIPCTLPQVLADVLVGQRILFDDGKIGGLIEQVAGDRLQVRITQARAGGAKLRADKGINLPDSSLHVASLSEQDLEHLDFAVAHADMVGLSFVRSPQDVLDLERELDRRGGSQLGIVLKVETRAAFEQLPNLLLTALQSPPVGVMVARGDLAVEMGFERLAEVQEQILWLCEAAHVPVIWATQVLESLAKKGLPSRAEVTDAAMSGRAECVMLNKGPHVLNAVRFLDDVMTRMQAHQTKKRAVLRKLSVSDRLVDTRPVPKMDPG